MVEDTIHTCNQGQKFEEIENLIAEVKSDLDEHRAAQQQNDIEREKRLEERRKVDKELSDRITSISNQIGELLELNKEVGDFKTAWRVGKNLGFGLAIFVTTIGIISGGVYAVKEWLRK